jgi:transcriptional regulator with GAF, ATPase, and Fis domain
MVEIDHYTALYRVARAINATLDLDEVLHLVARNVTEAVGAKGCAIRLLDQRGTLHLVASHGLSEEFLEKGHVRADADPATEGALSGAPVIAHIDDPSAWQYPEETRREGIASSCTVALRLDRGPIGILRVYAAERRDFRGRDLELLEALADLAALAIKNAQAHTAMRDEFVVMQEYTFGIHPTR